MSEEYNTGDNVTKKYMENVEKEFKDLTSATDPVRIPQEIDEAEWRIEISNVYEFIGMNQTRKRITDIFFEPFVAELDLIELEEAKRPTHFKPAIELRDGSIHSLTNLKIIESKDFFFSSNDELYYYQSVAKKKEEGIRTVHITGDYLGTTYESKVEINFLYISEEVVGYCHKYDYQSVVNAPQDEIIARICFEYIYSPLIFIEELNHQTSSIGLKQYFDQLVITKGGMISRFIIDDYGVPSVRFITSFLGIIYADARWRKFKARIEWT